MVSSKGERLRGKLNLVEMLGALKDRSQWMYDEPTGRNDLGSVSIIRAALSISSQKHLRQVPQGDGADQGDQAERIPTVRAEMQDAETVRQRGKGHQEEEGSREVTVYAPTA